VPEQCPDLDTLISYLKRWEAGKSGISERYRFACAKALGMDQRELFGPQPTEYSEYLLADGFGVAGKLGQGLSLMLSLPCVPARLVIEISGLAKNVEVPVRAGPEHGLIVVTRAGDTA
jgi:hypothetical protein